MIALFLVYALYCMWVRGGWIRKAEARSRALLVKPKWSNPGRGRLQGRVTGDGRMAVGMEGLPSDCRPGKGPQAGWRRLASCSFQPWSDWRDGGRLIHTLHHAL